jgi:hypothetical protein
MIFRSLALTLACAAGVSSFAFAPSHHHGARFHPSKSSMASTAALDTPPPLSPLTQWGEKISDIRRVQQELRQQTIPEFAPEISAKNLKLSDDPASQLEYIQTNAMALKQMMQDHGAVVFRDFELMKTQPGFQDFYKALGMKVCLDPLHSVSARPTVDGTKNSPVYEAVNKESRKNFFIGTFLIYSTYVNMYDRSSVFSTARLIFQIVLSIKNRHAQRVRGHSSASCGSLCLL